MKIAFWDISPFSLVEVASVSDVVAAYIIGVMSVCLYDGSMHL
jgi:hypothetical protein